MGTVLVAAAVGALLGTALGLFGGGGGILAVPLLVGTLGMDVDQAATASLVIVLFGAIAGLVSHHRAGRVLWRSGAVFGAATIVGSTVGALAAVAVADWVKLAAFCVLLVVAGVLMLRNARRQPGRAGAGTGPAGAGADAGTTAGGRAGEPTGPDQPRHATGSVTGPATIGAATARPAEHVASLPLLILLATGTGLVTGFLGVGGGFLVVPALVLSLRMPVANATATGLLVVAIASTSALAVRLMHAEALQDAGVTALIVLATVAASTMAARFSGRLSPRALGTGFAMLVLGMSVLLASQAWSAYQAHHSA